MSFEFRYYEVSTTERGEILDKVREELLSTNDILFAYIYGSFLKRKYFRDIDIAVWIKDSGKIFDYIINLSVKLTIKIGFPVDIQVLNKAPLTFKYHVFTEGKLVFSRSEDLRAKLIDRVIKEYIDFNLLYQYF